MKVTFRKAGAYDTYAGLQFAVVDHKNNKMVSNPQKCKEIFAYEQADVANKKIKRYRFLITLSHSAGRILNAENTQDFLNQVEKEMGFAKSRVWNVTDSAPSYMQALLIDCSGRWLQSSPLLHLLLLLARSGSSHKIGKSWRSTLSAFRRNGTFQETDQAQFLVARDAISHAIARKGKLEYVRYDQYNNLIVDKNSTNWQKGMGICTWATNLKEAGII